MVRPIKMGTPHKPKSCDFESIIGFGQNPDGFTAETANGTAKCGNNPGWNKRYKAPSFKVPAEGAWSNSNRTGE